jgi:hypothetical protein
LRDIFLKIHTDKASAAIIGHCHSYGVTIEVANDFWGWLILEPQEDTPHFEQHWKALGVSDQEKFHFPWNLAGKESHGSITASPLMQGQAQNQAHLSARCIRYALQTSSVCLRELGTQCPAVRR